MGLTLVAAATDREVPLAFFDFPPDHWVHLRTTNPIEINLATLHHRTSRTKNRAKRSTFLALAFRSTRRRPRPGDASVLPRKRPSCSVGRATKTGFRCATTPRIQKRSNGSPPDQTPAPKVTHQICR